MTISINSMNRIVFLALAGYLILTTSTSSAFVTDHRTTSTTTLAISSATRTSHRCQESQTCRYALNKNKSDNDNDINKINTNGANNENKFLRSMKQTVAVSALALGLSVGALGASPLPAMASDSKAIVGCLITKCQVPFLKCITNPKCLANVACINTCNGKDDEIGCQIKCGDLFENEVVGEFNKCAVSDMSCVPQQKDEGLYPEPSTETLVPKFDTKLWNGKWYITAGQNPLFDVHFFTETSPGKFFGKLNWLIEEPDGETFNRDAIQQFVQDPKWPGHLVNHDNEYLHYKDDWYIIDYEYDDNPTNTPPFAFVYYRGSNDAWDGYGGVVVYTRDAKLPESLLPRLRDAAAKIGYDFDKDFTITDNSCRPIDSKESLLLKEKFAGKVILQTEKAIQLQSTKFRGTAINSVKAQKIFFSDESKAAQEAYERLSNDVKTFEKSFSK